MTTALRTARKVISLETINGMFSTISNVLRVDYGLYIHEDNRLFRMQISSLMDVEYEEISTLNYLPPKLVH
ncbi:hypothetical protein N7495_003962 [Penicillium taxi]|uniref:uncharacterized protein n=1 Tax=Penicillium taxi TaxID=168475 RepID=UPI00254510CA|nr:uncharacterized protein N7495_003962 [Penicillium taxi]KAJ5899218.1 hypothetical protein N7495_003962 [Penicillium taxi]